MAQARTEFAAALNQIASEKGVDTEVVLDAIRSAALAAYKKDLVLRNEPIPEDIEEYTSNVDPVTGEISIYRDKENVTPPGFARIAAGIARQVIMQRLHEAEKGAIMSEYETKVGTIMSGSIQRQEGNTYFIDLGRAEGVMPPSEQVHGETYLPNQRMKFYIKGIKEEGRGPQVVVSRTDSGLVKGLFAFEVPEIQSGNVEIKAIAREPGSRTKIAAISHQEGVDPVGSLVGQKGVRVQTVMGELGDEKIDIITFSDDPARFIVAALAPAKDITVTLNEAENIATVSCPQNQLSLAIGKGGQNVRLAAKLTGWKIDIEGTGEPEVVEEAAPTDKQSLESEDSEPDETSAAQPEEKVIEAETPEEGREKAETEATNPEETPEEAVAEAVQENITEAMQEEAADGEVQEEGAPEPEAAAQAEADIAEEDAKNDSGEDSDDK